MIKKIFLCIFLVQISILANDLEDEQSLEIIVSSDENPTRVDIQKYEDPIWFKPLIIDGNNHDFDIKNSFEFKQNVVYKPSSGYTYPYAYNNYCAAIIIAKDNITIDLHGYTLALDPASAPNFMVNNPTYGIAIMPGVKNTRIISTSPKEEKGCIFGFSGFGIFAYGNNLTFNNYDIYANYVKNLTIHNILVTQNINGICIANALETSIKDTNVIYNFSPRTLYGMYYLNVLSGTIDNCIMNQNFSYSDLYGLYLQDTLNIAVSNSKTSFNQTFKSGNIYGMYITASTPTSSYGNQLYKCQASHNLCPLDKSQIGFTINNHSHHNVIEQCSSVGNSDITSGFMPLFTEIGFKIDTSNYNILDNNQAHSHSTYGFLDTAEISNSFYTRNFGILNSTNFNIMMPNHGGAPSALETILLYPNELTAYLASGPVLENIEVQFTS